MPQDLFTLKKTAEKLNEEVKNAVINKVVQPSENEFCLTLYNGKQFALVFSANGNLSRVAISYKIHKAPLVAPNFCMLLRKHLLGGRIKCVSIACDDRILAFEIENENEFKISKTYFLYAEIMNKFSNVFLTYDGVILGSLKNAPQNLDSKRIILRGAKYVFPKKLNKKRAFYKEELHEVFANYNGENLEKFLLDNFVDFSPVSAREIAYISKKYELSPLSAVEKFLLKPLCPTIIKTDRICDFFAFDYEHLKGERVYYNDFLKAQQEFFENLENEQKNNAYKSYLSSKISAYEKRYLKKLLAVEKSENDFLVGDKFRLYGELLTANLFRLKKGQKSVFIENYYEENCPLIEILLDENLSPQQNAQKYFKKYSKLKKAYEYAIKLKGEILSELEYLNSIKLGVENLSNKEDYEQIKKELIMQSIINEKSNCNLKKQKTAPSISNFKVYKVEDFIIKVGKNNLQNDYLFYKANKFDIWLHAKNYHSAHAYILTENKELPNSVLLTTAEIVASFSKAKLGDKVEVDYTFKKFVKKQPGAKPGSVFYTDYKTIVATPNSHDELLI